MLTYTCDGCGWKLEKHALRYSIKIETRAAYDDLEIGLTELVQDHRQEMIKLIEQMKHKDPKAIEESIYKAMQLDLCPACHRAYIQSPLHFHPEQGADDASFDIDDFLRSLGYGKATESSDEA